MSNILIVDYLFFALGSLDMIYFVVQLNQNIHSQFSTEIRYDENGADIY